MDAARQVGPPSAKESGIDERVIALLHSGTTIDSMARRCVEAEAERDALREALEKVEPLIDAQLEGHANVAEFMEKVQKLNEVLDVVRAALERSS